MSTGDSCVTRVVAAVLLCGIAAGAASGCRAETTRCELVAAHIADLAEREDKPAPGLSLAIESDCQAEPRPSEALVECMLAAQSLAELDAC